MPATQNHLATNFARIEAGVLDHVRVNNDLEAAQALRKLLVKADRQARQAVQAALKASGKVVKQSDLTDDQIAQPKWDAVIALAVEAGVQTSIPGTRGNEFRKAARVSQTAEEAVSGDDEDDAPAE